MVWLSDPTLNAIDEQLSLEREQALANLNAPTAPSYTPDYAAQDASMLGAFSRPTVYEDGSLSDGGSYVDAGYSNPWITDWGAQDASYLQQSFVPSIRDDGYFEDSFGEPQGGVWGAGLFNPEWSSGSSWEQRDFTNQDQAYFDFTDPGNSGFTGAGIQGMVPPGYESPNVIDLRGLPGIKIIDGKNYNLNFLGEGAGGTGMPRGWWDGSDPAADAAVSGATWNDWGAQDAAYFDTQGPTYQAPNLSPYGPPDPNPWQPEIDESYFQTQPAPVYDFGAQEDQSYFEGPSSQQALGDWIYKYQDWGGTQDQAYFDTVSSPENPQDAAQKFLYNPPKIDPANLGSAGTPIWDAIDNTILKPLDFASEIGGDWTPNLLRTLPLTAPSTLLYDAVSYGANALGANLPTLNNPLEVTQRTGENFTDYEGAVSDFRDRPVWQQLLYGTVYDPTAFIPGLGASDEVGGAIKSAWTAARGNADELLQSPGLRSLAGTLDDELGAVQIGRTTPLKVGDVVRDAAGAEWTVAKNFDGTINGWVNVVDETTETGVKKIKRGMLDAAPVGGVDDVAGVGATAGVSDDFGALVEQARTAPTIAERQAARNSIDEMFQPRDLATLDEDAQRLALIQAETAKRQALQDVLQTDPAARYKPTEITEAKWGSIYDRPLTRQEASALNQKFPDTFYSVGDTLRDQKHVEYLDNFPGLWRRGDAAAPTLRPSTPTPSPGRPPAVPDPTLSAALPTTDAPTPIRPAATAGAATPPPRVPPTDIPTASNDELWDSAIAKITTAAKKSESMYRTGFAQDQLRAGRANQFGNIRDAIRTGNGSAEDIANAARGAAKGKFDFAKVQAVELSPGERNAVFLRINDEVAKGTRSPADILRLSGKDGILAKIEDGRRLQKNELKWVRENMNSELADVLATRKMTRAQELAQEAKWGDQALATEDRLIKKMQNEIAVAERQYQAARAASQMTNDRAAMRARWKVLAKQNDASEVQKILSSPFLTEEERAIAAKALAQEAKRTEWKWDAIKKWNPAADNLRQTALNVIRKNVDDPELAKELERSIALWVDQTRPLVDAIGEQRMTYLADRIADITGDVGDSYLTALLHRREYLRAGLEKQGLDEKVAKKVADTLMKSELQRRYKAQGGIPERILGLLDDTKADLGSRSYKIASGLAEGSQMLKNSQFGIGDFAVMGQQGLKDVQTSWPQMIAAMANRVLNKAHLGIDTRLLPENEVARRVQYTLDGLAPQGARTGLSDYSSEGTVFSMLGRPGKWLDEKAVIPFSSKLNDIQFDWILGNLRNLNYEGNLVLAHLARQDITDPRVRAAAAGFANNASSFAPKALDATRAQFEKGFILSPSMRRAQFGIITKVAKGLTMGTPTERLLAATTITAWAGSLLVVGKLLNDYIGIEEFQWDPSKPGFGRITTGLTNSKGQHIVIDLFPQEQVMKAIAGSARALAEGDPMDAAKAWGNLGVMSMSPAARPVVGGAAGIGYEPGKGVRYGDLNKNVGLKGRLLNAAPIPPFFQSLVTESLPMGARGAEFSGFNTYAEGEIATLNRMSQAKYGKEFFDLDTDVRNAFLSSDDKAKGLFESWSNRRLEDAQRGVDDQDLRTIDFERRAQRINEIEGDRLVNQQSAYSDYEAKLAAATTSDQRMELAREFRETISDIQFNAGLEKRATDDAFKLFKDSGTLPTDPNELAKVQFFNLFDLQGMKLPNGRTNSELYEAEYNKLAAAWSPEQRAYVENEVQGRKYNIPEVQQYYADVDKIAASGYFDLTEGKREFRQANPEIADLVRKWGYSPTSIAAEDLTNRYADMQKVDDEALAANSITPEEWRTNYRSRMDELRAGKDVLYAGLEEDGESTKPLDQWFAQIEAATAANGQDVDWDKVDAWIAAQPADVQATIDGYTGTALTPLVAEYRADVKVIADSGYWDVRDQVFDYWIQSLGMESGIIKEDEYFDLVRQAYVGYAEEYLDANSPGWRAANPQAAVLMAQVPLNSLESKFQSGVTKANASFREQAPEVAWLIRKWGYGGTGKEELGKALAGTP